MAQPQSSQDWKQKYLASLEQLESRGKQWSELESLLRLAVRRLSVAAEGIDPILDDQLVKIREVVGNHKQSSELASLIDDISRSVKRLDQQQPCDGMAVSNFADSLATLVNSIEWPKGVRRKAKGLSKCISASHEPQQMKTMLAEFARLITDSFAFVANDDDMDGFQTRSAKTKGKQQSVVEVAALETPHALPLSDKQPSPSATRILLDLLDQVRVSDSKSADIKALRARISEAREEEVLRALAIDVRALLSSSRERVAAESQPRSHPDIARIQDVLIQLLDYLGLPEDLLPQADELEGKLGQELDTKQLTTILQTIADLVSQLRSRVDEEKREFEGFLIQLTDRLQDLGQHLQLAHTQQRASIDSRRELDEVVRSQVKDIESSVHEASSLDHLKVAVQEHLDSIRRDLDTYRRNEEKSHIRMEQEVKVLTSRLQEMETECQQLRERAQREHMQAVTDALTGTYNRSAYEIRLAQEYARWKRYQTPFALLLWDVDGFKVINDSYGHAVGDNALKLIADVLKENLRDADFTARYGGDEFAALLSETSLEMALVVAEKLRTAIVGSQFHHDGTPVAIALSCGIASIQPEDTLDTMFQRADAALYKAKRSGKNRCVSEKDI
ncbi:MAG: diguanylate cyclase [Gammaproteobacteria bacterium]|nr:diguanylate cyclase [Gammaproteobacteria bacterium]